MKQRFTISSIRKRHVTANFKISHVTVQVESDGCAQRETHL
jgi:hypothetical protein